MLSVTIYKDFFKLRINHDQCYLIEMKYDVLLGINRGTLICNPLSIYISFVHIRITKQDKLLLLRKAYLLKVKLYLKSRIVGR